jgi:hypothetical protein
VPGTTGMMVSGSACGSDGSLKGGISSKGWSTRLLSYSIKRQGLMPHNMVVPSRIRGRDPQSSSSTLPLWRYSPR